MLQIETNNNVINLITDGMGKFAIAGATCSLATVMNIIAQSNEVSQIFPTVTSGLIYGILTEIMPRNDPKNYPFSIETLTRNALVITSTLYLGSTFIAPQINEYFIKDSLSFMVVNGVIIATTYTTDMIYEVVKYKSNSR